MELRAIHCGANRLLAVAALLCFSSSVYAQGSNPCDLNGDGLVNSGDVTISVNMALGTVACAANVEAPSTCTIVTVQRIVDATQGQPCVAYNSHNVTLSWVASATSGVVGYNVYRGTTSGGPYTLVSPSLIAAVNYIDLTVAPGLAYFYVVTAVDGSGDESTYSNEAQAVVPTS